MLELIKLVFESLCRALIRFFDNRFVRNNDVEWYRMELERSRIETQKYIDYLVAPKIVVPEVTDSEEFRPVQTGKFVSWESKRRQLEMESYRKAQELAAEAKIAINRNKTTEQLEQELLDGTD